MTKQLATSCTESASNIPRTDGAAAAATTVSTEMLALINRLLDWFRSLFWKEEMELTLVGLQYSGKTTFVNVIAVRDVKLASVHRQRGPPPAWERLATVSPVKSASRCRSFTLVSSASGDVAASVKCVGAFG